MSACCDVCSGEVDFSKPVLSLDGVLTFSTSKEKSDVDEFKMLRKHICSDCLTEGSRIAVTLLLPSVRITFESSEWHGTELMIGPISAEEVIGGRS